MGDSLYDMFLKEYEKYFPVHAMMQASAAKSKTPYQLDLEVKNRKPSITPKVGDKVKIKSREWYEKWKDSAGNVRFDTTDCAFVNGMKDLCGRDLTVRDVIEYKFSKDEKRWKLSTNDWYFVPEMFEEVYPEQEQVDTYSPRIELSYPANCLQHFRAREGELIVHKKALGSMIEDTVKRIDYFLSPKGLTAKPKLKQIKTTHLIKLKKL